MISDKRICSNCGSNWTHLQVRNKKTKISITELWHRDNKGGWMCQNCYSLIVSTKKHNPKLNARRMKFKGQIIFLDSPARIGVCNWCRTILLQTNAQTNKVCKHTHLHHEQYDENNKQKYTIELCDSCHSRHHHPKKASG